MSSSKLEVPESSQAHLMDFNGKARDEVQAQPPSAELSTEKLASPTVEDAQQSAEKIEVHPSRCVNSVVEQDFIFKLEGSSGGSTRGSTGWLTSQCKICTKIGERWSFGSENTMVMKSVLVKDPQHPQFGEKFGQFLI